MSIPLNIDIQQILLHLFNFAILAFGLYFLLYKPVKDFMAARQAHYETMKAEAEDHLKKAKESEELYAQRLKGADEEIAQKHREAAARAHELERIRMDETEAKAAKLMAEARENAGREREKMLAEAREEISEMAVTAVEKLMSDSVSSAYDEFLNSVGLEGEAASDAGEPSRMSMSEAEAKAAMFLAEARKNADREHDKIIAEAREEISEMAATAVEKLVKGSLSESYDEFLNAAERSVSDEHI